jgi:hypothetical protein
LLQTYLYNDIPWDSRNINSDPQSTGQQHEAFEPPSDLVDIAPVAEAHVAEPEDLIRQTEVLNNIIVTTFEDPADEDAFTEKRRVKLKLSQLKRSYDLKDPHVVDLLARRNSIVIDKKFKLEFGRGQILMHTNKTMLDYQLTVPNCMGFASVLPNASSAHRFYFNMDLKKPTTEFKGKHAMIGFDTKGKMLYLGLLNGEYVYLTMAPNEFLNGHFEPCPAGYSTGSSTMQRQHYRQIVMMLAYFLAKIPILSYSNIGDVYDQDLEDTHPVWSIITNIM